MKKEEVGELATIVGRYYAMDRDKRWDRVKIAIDGLVGGVGETTDDPVAAIKANYEKDLTDEFLKPIICNGDAGRVTGMCSQSLVFLGLKQSRWRLHLLLQLSVRPYA